MLNQQNCKEKEGILQLFWKFDRIRRSHIFTVLSRNRIVDDFQLESICLISKLMILLAFTLSNNITCDILIKTGKNSSCNQNEEFLPLIAFS